MHFVYVFVCFCVGGAIKKGFSNIMYGSVLKGTKKVTEASSQKSFVSRSKKWSQNWKNEFRFKKVFKKRSTRFKKWKSF